MPPKTSKECIAPAGKGMVIKGGGVNRGFFVSAGKDPGHRDPGARRVLVRPWGFPARLSFPGAHARRPSITAVEAAGMGTLSEGQKVKFEVVEDPRGLKASDLAPAEE